MVFERTGFLASLKERRGNLPHDSISHSTTAELCLSLVNHLLVSEKNSEERKAGTAN